MGTAGAMLLTRVAVRAGELEPFDSWQRSKHLVELAAVDGLAAVSYYAARAAEMTVERSANRMAAYWASNVAGLAQFLEDPRLEAAVQDGSSFFGSFEPLDGAEYTGNVYELDAAGLPPMKGPLVVQRVEVEPDVADVVDRRLRDELSSALRDLSVTWSAIGRRVDLPTAVPYYGSPGNRAVLAEAADQGHAEDIIALLRAFRWGCVGAYDRLEVNDVLVAFEHPPANLETTSWQK